MAIVPKKIYKREFVGQTTIPDVALKIRDHADTISIPCHLDFSHS